MKTDKDAFFSRAFLVMLLALSICSGAVKTGDYRGLLLKYSPPLRKSLKERAETELKMIRIDTGRNRYKKVTVLSKFHGMPLEDQYACAFLTGIRDDLKNMVFPEVRYRDCAFYHIRDFRVTAKYLVKGGRTELKWRYIIEARFGDDYGNIKQGKLVLRFLAAPSLKLLTFCDPCEHENFFKIEMSSQTNSREYYPDPRVNSTWDFDNPFIDYNKEIP